jgi:hypothetical protein
MLNFVDARGLTVRTLSFFKVRFLGGRTSKKHIIA